MSITLQDLCSIVGMFEPTPTQYVELSIDLDRWNAANCTKMMLIPHGPFSNTIAAWGPKRVLSEYELGFLMYSLDGILTSNMIAQIAARLDAENLNLEINKIDELE